MYVCQKSLEVCYCLWECHPDPRLSPILGPSRSHPGSEAVPSEFAMCFVLQRFGPIQVPRWGPSRPVLVPSCSRAFLPGSSLDGPKQTSWPLPSLDKVSAGLCCVPGLARGLFSPPNPQSCRNKQTKQSSGRTQSVCSTFAHHRMHLHQDRAGLSGESLFRSRPSLQHVKTSSMSQSKALRRWALGNTCSRPSECCV